MHGALPSANFASMNIASDKFILISGPCAIEGESLAMDIAGQLQELTSELGIPYIFKGSYRKANRTKLDSFSGIGDEIALNILSRIRQELQVQTTTDIHESIEVDLVAKHVDVLQIPAFLCRQTALLLAAAQSGRIVNIKKGQFMSAGAMKYAVDKVKSVDGSRAWLTERGTTFGYGDLVVDFRSIVDMKKYADVVVMDATHSLQRPNTAAGVTGGQPEYIQTMACAAMAAGANALFIETHPDPSTALSDGANMLPMHEMRRVLEAALRVKSAVS